MTDKWLKHRQEVQEWVRGLAGVPGRNLRRVLNGGKWWWQRWSAPQFYTLMAIMEDEGEIVGAWQYSDDGAGRERVYTCPTRAGRSL